MKTIYITDKDRRNITALYNYCYDNGMKLTEIEYMNETIEYLEGECVVAEGIRVIKVFELEGKKYIKNTFIFKDDKLSTKMTVQEFIKWYEKCKRENK